jgi:hypothetical protein
MTATETARSLIEADPAVPWPPEKCPDWCISTHEAEEQLGNRSCFAVLDEFSLSIEEASGEDLDSIVVSVWQYAGRPPVVYLELGYLRSIGLTQDEAKHLRDELTRALDLAGAEVTPGT